MTSWHGIPEAQYVAADAAEVVEEIPYTELPSGLNDSEYNKKTTAKFVEVPAAVKPVPQGAPIRLKKPTVPDVASALKTLSISSEKSRLIEVPGTTKDDNVPIKDARQLCSVQGGCFYCTQKQ
jgi:hypothetical protein